MSVSGSRAAIETYFSSSWAARRPEVQVLYPNESRKLDSGSIPWIDFDVQYGPARYETKSPSGKNLVTGFASVNVYVPRGTGTVSGSLIADSIRDVFTSASLNNHYFGAPSGPVSVPNEEEWAQQNITVSFILEETRP